MYRLIVNPERKDYKVILALADQPAEVYVSNDKYATLILSPDAFLIASIKYDIYQHIDDDGKSICDEYTDMPTYAVIDY